jgi:hypothetical protein
MFAPDDILMAISAKIVALIGEGAFWLAKMVSARSGQSCDGASKIFCMIFSLQVDLPGVSRKMPV